MTQNTQTTAERIRNLIFDAIQDSPYGDESIVAAPLGVTIAAEIDRLTAERDEARAEVERLRLPAEAWIAYDDYMMCPEEHEAEKFPVWVAAHKAAKSAQVARAAKESQP